MGMAEEAAGDTTERRVPSDVDQDLPLLTRISLKAEDRKNWVPDSILQVLLPQYCNSIPLPCP